MLDEIVWQNVIFKSPKLFELKNEEKHIWVFLFQKIWQKLKHFNRQFHQAKISYF